MSEIYSYKSLDIYRDRASSDKNWLRIIPIPGRPIQNNELIELQSIVQNQLKLALSSIYKNHSPIDGLRIYIQENTIKVTPGKFFIDGFVLDIPSAIFSQNIAVDSQTALLNSIDFEETITIGIKVDEQIITEIEDPSLRDLINNTNLYGYPGAHRLVWNAKVVFNDPSSFQIGYVKRGVVYQSRISSIGKLEDLIALTNYERNGNYISSGYEVEANNQFTSINQFVNYSGYYSPESTNLKFIRSLQESLDEAQLNYDNLSTSLSSALRDYNNNPTDTASSFINKSSKRLNNILYDIDFYRSKLSESINNLNVDYGNLRSEGIIDEIIVAPGIASVKGYRVEKSSSTKFSIPRVLSEGRVIGAKFRYRNDNSVTRRSILLHEGYTIPGIKTLEKELYISLSGILYQELSLSPKITVLLNNNLPEYVINMDSLIDFIVNELVFSISLHPNIQIYDHTSPDRDRVVLRSIINNNLIISKVSNNTIEFSSITASIKMINTTTSTDFMEWDRRSTYIGDASTLRDFQLGFRPVVEIDSLVADLEKLNEAVIRSNGDRDMLGDDSVFSVIRVFQGGISFTENIDFILDGLNSIRWISSNRPNLNSIYYVSYIYTEPLEQDIHYRLNRLNDSIEFISDKKPVQGGTFTVDYTYAIDRYGYVSLNRFGNIKVQFNELDVKVIPSPPKDELLLSKLVMNPKGIEVYNNEYSKSLTVSQLNSFEQRLKEIEINIDTTLDIIEGYGYVSSETPLSISKSFLFEKLNEDINYVESTFSYLPLIGAAGPISYYADLELRRVSGGHLIRNNLDNTPSAVCLPYSNNTLPIGVERETTSSINLTYIERDRAYIHVSPRSFFYNYTADSTDTNVTYPSSYISLLLSNNINSPSISKFARSLFRNYTRYILPLNYDVQSSIEYGISYDTLYTLDELKDLEGLSGIKIRPDYILVYSWNLPKSKKGFTVYIDGDLVDNLIPLEGTQIVGNTLTSSFEGELKFKIFLPSDLNTGSYIISIVRGAFKAEGIFNIMNNPVNNMVMSSNNIWDSSVDLLTYSDQWNYSEGIINTNSTYDISVSDTSSSSLYTNSRSPINQLFICSSTFFIDSIDISYTNLGISGTYILFRETLLSGEYSNVEYIPSESVLSKGFPISTIVEDGISTITYKFPEPIKVNRGDIYCVSIESLGDEYTLLTNNFNYKEDNDYLIFYDDYNNYKLLLSSDGYSLIESSNQNLIYNLNICNFSEDMIVTVDLGNYNHPSSSIISHFSLNCGLLVPESTSISFEYNGGSGWKSFYPNSLISIDSNSSVLSLRANLYSSDVNVSPILSLEGSSVALYTNSGSIIIYSKPIISTDTYTNVEVHIELKVNSTTTMSVIGSSTSGDTWFNLNKDPREFLIDSTGTVVRYIYRKVDLPSNVIRNNFIFKINCNFTQAHDFSFIKVIKVYAY